MLAVTGIQFTRSVTKLRFSQRKLTLSADAATASCFSEYP